MTQLGYSDPKKQIEYLENEISKIRLTSIICFIVANIIMCTLAYHLGYDRGNLAAREQALTKEK